MAKIGKDLTQGNIRQILIQLTLPMIFGILSIIAFNLADTYFVGKIGTLPMAALTFTFPVVTVINSINLGIGIGTSAVVSRAVGTQDADRVKRLSTDSLTLGIIFSVIAVIIGELTIYPLFTALGAGETVMPYIVNYMRIWYAGVPFIVIPMIGNNAIRALGDTKTPSIVMFCSAITNIILDPLLIFGFGPIPAMGVQGAAIATVFSRGLTFLFAMYVLAIREKVVSLKGATMAKILDSWKTIIYIGVPNAIARMIVPVGAGIITGLISGFGYEAVAGFGIATRLEFLALAVVGSLASVIPVFVGQNYGAGAFERIKEGLKMSQRFALIYGALIFSLLYVFARPIATIFTKEVAVIEVVVTYMRIAPIGYAFMGSLQILTSGFNAMHKPIHSALINLIQMMGIYVPLAMVGARYMGITGIFVAMAFSYLVMSTPSYQLLKRVVREEEMKYQLS
jgi:putative MATE family efflux protein